MTSEEEDGPPGTPPPANGEGSSEGYALRSRKRLTLDFSGPPLGLPSEAPPERAESKASSSRPPSRPTRRSSRPALDAWSRDRLRRSSEVHPIPSGDGLDTEVDALDEDRPRDLGPDVSVVPGATGETDALQLVDRGPEPSPGHPLAEEMADCYALGDFTGALRAAELLLGINPRHGEAMRTAASARNQLEGIYSARLGSTLRVPVVHVPDSEIRWLGLDHRSGFLLSRIDGTHTIEEVVAMSGMQRLEALRLLVELVEADAVRFE